MVLRQRWRGLSRNGTNRSRVAGKEEKVHLAVRDRMEVVPPRDARRVTLGAGPRAKGARLVSQRRASRSRRPEPDRDAGVAGVASVASDTGVRYERHAAVVAAHVQPGLAPDVHGAVRAAVLAL